MPRPEKEKKVADLAQKLQRSQMAVVADYRGMTVREMSNLRGQLRGAGTEFHVVKNTLARLAIAGSELLALEPALTGTTAIAFCFGEVTGPAKILADFARTSKLLKIRAAYLQGRLLSAEQLEGVANLPPLPVLQAQLLGALQGPGANLVGVLSSPMQGLLAVLQARSQQLGPN